MVSLSVAELLLVGLSVTPAGAVTVAVLDTEAYDEYLSVEFRLEVARPFASRLIVLAMAPLPEAAPQLEPAVAEQRSEERRVGKGRRSGRLAPVSKEGP